MKRRPGRPTVVVDAVPVAVKLPAEMVAKIDVLAERSGVNRSTMMRRLLGTVLDRT